MKDSPNCNNVVVKKEKLIKINRNEICTSTTFLLFNTSQNSHKFRCNRRFCSFLLISFCTDSRRMKRTGQQHISNMNVRHENDCNAVNSYLVFFCFTLIC